MTIYTICILFVVSVVSTFGAAEVSDKVIICHYESWANRRSEKAKVDIGDLNPNLCTIIMYAFVGISGNGDVVILDPENDIVNNGFKNFLKLKEINPNVKLGVTVGGWNQGSENFSKVAEDPKLRQTFSRNVIFFMVTYGFDVFGIDWEYPCERGGKPQDKENYIELLKSLRIVFDVIGWLLVADVGATKNRQDISYDVQNMNKYLHFMNIMAYDFHGSWESTTGHNAPLTPGFFDKTPDLNVKAAVNDWIKAGADPSRLTLGLPFYGRTFTLRQAYDSRVGAPAIGPGYPGAYTGEAGTLSYLEICTNITTIKWQYRWTVLCAYQEQVPYAFNKNQWVSFDNVRSIQKKVNYAMEMNLAGVMIWAIDYDDIRNECKAGNWPLLNAVNNRIKGKPPKPIWNEPFC